MIFLKHFSVLNDIISLIKFFIHFSAEKSLDYKKKNASVMLNSMYTPKCLPFDILTQTSCNKFQQHISCRSILALIPGRAVHYSLLFAENEEIKSEISIHDSAIFCLLTPLLQHSSKKTVLFSLLWQLTIMCLQNIIPGQVHFMI